MSAMAKTITNPRLKPREYSVQIEGWPLRRFQALSDDMAELVYRQQLGLKLGVAVVQDITSQLECNGGLTDAEMKLRMSVEAEDAVLRAKKQREDDARKHERLEIAAAEYLEARAAAKGVQSNGGSHADAGLAASA